MQALVHNSYLERCQRILSVRSHNDCTLSFACVTKLNAGVHPHFVLEQSADSAPSRKTDSSGIHKTFQDGLRANFSARGLHPSAKSNLGGHCTFSRSERRNVSQRCILAVRHTKMLGPNGPRNQQLGPS